MSKFINTFVPSLNSQNRNNWLPWSRTQWGSAIRSAWAFLDVLGPICGRIPRIPLSSVSESFPESGCGLRGTWRGVVPGPGMDFCEVRAVVWWQLAQTAHHNLHCHLKQTSSQWYGPVSRVIIHSLTWQEFYAMEISEVVALWRFSYRGEILYFTLYCKV